MRFTTAGITAHQSVGGHNGAQNWPVLLKGQQAVMGTGGIHLAAFTTYRRDKLLVELKCPDKREFCGRELSIGIINANISNDTLLYYR